MKWVDPPTDTHPPHPPRLQYSRHMQQMGRFILIAGVVLVVLGLIVWGLGRLGFRGLPGDIVHQGERVTIYFPIVTCIVLSILLTAAMWLWQWLSR